MRGTFLHIQVNSTKQVSNKAMGRVRLCSQISTSATRVPASTVSAKMASTATPATVHLVLLEPTAITVSVSAMPMSARVIEYAFDQHSCSAEL